MADTTISNLYQKSTLNPTDYFVIDDGYKTYKMCAQSVFTSNLSAFNQGTGLNSTIAGGIYNSATEKGSTVGGGRNNTSSGCYSTISGGYKNNANDCFSNVGGGACNTVSGYYSNIDGGICNKVSGNCSSVSGGYSNCLTNDLSFVGGGKNNTANGISSTISGGYQNCISNGDSSVISGGYQNEVCGNYSAVGGGYYNRTNRNFSFIGGGSNNEINACCSAILGGFYNILNCSNSFAIGSNIMGNSKNTTYIGQDLCVCGNFYVNGNNVVNNVSTIATTSVSADYIVSSGSIVGGNNVVSPSFTDITNGSNSDQWNQAYSNLLANSAIYEKPVYGLENQIVVTNESNDGFPFYVISLPDNVIIPQDLTVSGNLNIIGETNQVGVSALTVQDPLIYLNQSLYGGASNLFDIGIVSHFIGPFSSLKDGTSGYQHTGIVRSALSGVWTLFSGLTTEPSSGPRLSYNDPYFYIETLRANIYGNLSGNNAYLKNNLGIGTNIPNEVLTVVGNISAGGVSQSTISSNLFVSNASNSNGYIIYDRNNSGYYSKLQRVNAATQILDNSSGSEIPLVTVLSGGNFGIGTTTPNQTLTVNGAISSNNTISSQSLVISGGNILLTPNNWINGANSGYFYLGDTSSYITNTNGGKMILSAYNGLLASTYLESNAININQSGKIGLGVAPTSSQLTVSGNLSATGTIYSQNMLNKYVTTIGGGLNNDFTITHLLNTKDVHVTVYDNNTGLIVYPSVQITNSTTIDVVFTTIPNSNQYRVVIIG
jgi:hypothetical protein